MVSMSSKSESGIDANNTSFALKSLRYEPFVGNGLKDWIEKDGYMFAMHSVYYKGK